jgi:hypothetical protein
MKIHKLVEAPYLGMEHQSSVTYGNGYQNGYRGRDLSGTGWGLSLILLSYMSLVTSGLLIISPIKIYAMWIHESLRTILRVSLEYYYGKRLDILMLEVLEI